MQQPTYPSGMSAASMQQMMQQMMGAGAGYQAGAGYAGVPPPPAYPTAGMGGYMGGLPQMPTMGAPGPAPAPAPAPSKRGGSAHGPPAVPLPRNVPIMNRGKWTPEEDEILRMAVERYEGKNWKLISTELHNRTDVQCLHRWQKVLKPGLIKGPWTHEEDEQLRQLFGQLGEKRWSEIAKHLPGRLGKQCRERCVRVVRRGSHTRDGCVGWAPSGTVACQSLGHVRPGGGARRQCARAWGSPVFGQP